MNIYKFQEQISYLIEEVDAILGNKNSFNEPKPNFQKTDRLVNFSRLIVELKQKSEIVQLGKETRNLLDNMPFIKVNRKILDANLIDDYSGTLFVLELIISIRRKLHLRKIFIILHEVDSKLRSIRQFLTQ